MNGDSGEKENSWQVVKNKRSRPVRKENDQSSCNGETKSDLSKTVKEVPGPDHFRFDLDSKEGKRKRENLTKWKKPKQLKKARSRGEKRKAEDTKNAEGSKKRELILISSLPPEDQDIINYKIYIRGELLGNNPEVVEIPQISPEVKTDIWNDSKKWYEEKFDVQLPEDWFEKNIPYETPKSGWITHVVGEDMASYGLEVVNPECEVPVDEPQTSKPKVRTSKSKKFFKRMRNLQIIYKKTHKCLNEVDKEELEYNNRRENSPSPSEVDGKVAEAPCKQSADPGVTSSGQDNTSELFQRCEQFRKELLAEICGEHAVNHEHFLAEVDKEEMEYNKRMEKEETLRIVVEIIDEIIPLPRERKRKEMSPSIPEDGMNNGEKENSSKRIKTDSPVMLDLSLLNEETASDCLKSPLTDILDDLDSSDDDKETKCHTEEPCEDLVLQLSDTEDEETASGD